MGLFEELPILETDRLRLQTMQPDDVEDIFEYASDLKVTVHTIWPAHQSIEDSKRFLEEVMEKAKSDRVARWAIVHKADAKLIGSCALFNWSPLHGRAEIGCALSSQYWGKGHATEAIRAAIAWSFNAMNLNRLHGRCKAINIASARVMEKAGMKLEGVLRQHSFEKGIYHDMKIYAILRSEFFSNCG